MPQIVVLHYTGMASAAAARDRLCDPAVEVSAHYLIARDGDIIHMVDEAQRAWHAGHGEWRGQADINSRSIGIELDNAGTHPFSAPLMSALEQLLQDILNRWSIPPSEVIGHSDMAPGRKSDPGARFDWARLARQGLARPAGAGPFDGAVAPAQFRKAAQLAGFTAPVPDQTLLEAVRLRFRPFASGPLTAADMAALPRVD
ncbi:MAG: N-acetylmuramoyl-L-alanine amidase [Roseobacter sp.]